MRTTPGEAGVPARSASVHEMTWPLRRGWAVLSLPLVLSTIVAGCDGGPQVNSSLGSSGVITLTYPASGDGGRLLAITPSGVSTLTWRGRDVTARSDAPLPSGAWEQIRSTAPLASLQSLPLSTCATTQPTADPGRGAGADAGGRRLVIREGFRVLVDVRLPGCDPHAPVLDALLQAWLAPALTGSTAKPV